MNKVRGGGLVVTGLFILLAGVVLRLGILQFLIGVLGYLFIGVGVVIGVYGLIKMLSGGKSEFTDY